MGRIVLWETCQSLNVPSRKSTSDCRNNGFSVSKRTISVVPKNDRTGPYVLCWNDSSSGGVPGSTSIVIFSSETRIASRVARPVCVHRLERQTTTVVMWALYSCRAWMDYSLTSRPRHHIRSPRHHFHLISSHVSDLVQLLVTLRH